MFATTTEDNRRDGPEGDEKSSQTTATTEYCAKLQQWMWQYYWGYANWQSWLALSAFPFPPPCGFPTPGNSDQTPGAHATTSGIGQQAYDALNRYSYPYPLGFPASYPHPGGPHTEQTSATDARPAQLQNGNPPQAGREYTIPSPLLRFLAETVDFFILFCVKATIVLWIMHLSGMKDITKFITHFIVEEIDENTSMEDLQKMMAVALVYRVLVCAYEESEFFSNTTLPPTEDSDATLRSYLPEMKSCTARLVRLRHQRLAFPWWEPALGHSDTSAQTNAIWQTICIWGAGGATPGKFLLGLRVVTCDTSTLVRPNRVLVVPASKVSLSASTVRALNKNFSIAFLFPVFITLLFFQHNRTVYDIVAGTIVVQRRGVR